MCRAGETQSSPPVCVRVTVRVCMQAPVRFFFLPFRLNFNFNFKGERKSMITVINDLCVPFSSVALSFFFFKGSSGEIKVFDNITTSVIQPCRLCCDWTGGVLRGPAINRDKRRGGSDAR